MVDPAEKALCGGAMARGSASKMANAEEEKDALGRRSMETATDHTGAGPGAHAARNAVTVAAGSVAGSAAAAAAQPERSAAAEGTVHVTLVYAMGGAV